MCSTFSRREFIVSSAGLLSGSALSGFTENIPTESSGVDKKNDTPKIKHPFGDRRIYYNNFAEHLLNVYNPNMFYPGLPNRWSDADWKNLIDMIAGFGFNTFEFWLVPRLFSPEGISSDFGKEFVRQMNVVIEHARERSVKVSLLSALTTVGNDWKTYCPNVKSEWQEVRRLWDWWTKHLPGLELIDIFPGDPGGCSRNGCTAETYIDKTLEIALLVKQNLPHAEIQIGTWGPPFWGWGIIEGPPNWQGEFLQKYQSTGWKFDKQRVEKSMTHFLKRLPDFPDLSSVFINMGFNSSGSPEGDSDARAWAREIAKTRRILTWDFGLTEGENAILPHYRFDHLFQRRREERDAAPYSGGICFTMTPLLNQLSLYMSAQSFQNPDAEPAVLVRQFYKNLFGEPGSAIAEYLPLFEIIPDWGNNQTFSIPRMEYHKKMQELSGLIEGLITNTDGKFAFHPSPDKYRSELLYFARLFAQLSDRSPDYDALEKEYYQRIYSIYNFLPEHVDPRPKSATANLIQQFRNFK